MKKITWILSILIVIVIIVFIAMSSSGDESKFRVGVVLPMTGQSSIFGENIYNGMKLAMSELPDSQIILDVQDSQANPSVGISAYQKILIEKPQVVVTAFSGVSIPITKFSLQKKIPQIMTMVSGANVINDYSYRFFNPPEAEATSALSDEISPIKNGGDIAVLYRNDEHGKSVKDAIETISKKTGHKILIEESFLADAKDYKTQLLKISQTKPKALIYIVANPGEAIKLIKDAVELGVKFDLIEGSFALSDPKVQESLPPGRTYYSTSYLYLYDGNYESFKAKYKAAYGSDPNFTAPLGYDIMNLIYSCSKSNNVNKCLSETQKIEGATGSIELHGREINPPSRLIKIVK